jgi:hypothetical protein
VATSAAGEPASVLLRQLDVVYDQILFIVTSGTEWHPVILSTRPMAIYHSVSGLLGNGGAMCVHVLLCLLSRRAGLEKACARNPGFDVRGLLAGTSGVLRALTRSFAIDIGYLLDAVAPLPLPSPDRRAASEALQEAAKV